MLGMRLLLLALFVGCAPSPKAGAEDPCHPKPPPRCEQDSECAPYRCKTTFCVQRCESAAECAQGFACKEATCVKAGTCRTCSGDYDCAVGKKCDLGKSSCSP